MGTDAAGPDAAAVKGAAGPALGAAHTENFALSAAERGAAVELPAAGVAGAGAGAGAAGVSAGIAVNTARRRHRRVTTQAVPGSDPNPVQEPPRHAVGENDERLRADKPPHWG